MSLDECYSQYQGQSVSFDGIEANRGQCVQWVEIVHTHVYGAVPYYGNAIDWWNNFPGSSLEAIYNRTQDGSIIKGDIVVFNTNVGSVYGHIDVAMANGSYNQFTGADSNWAGNKTVHLVNHVGAQYILGVLRLKGGNNVAIIQDTDNWFARVDKTFQQVRGRSANRGDFAPWIGQDFLHLVEAVEDDPEADIAQNWQTVGQVAVRDDWQGQIETLTKELADAQKGFIPYVQPTLYTKKD